MLQGIEDSRFNSNAARIENLEMLDNIIADWCRGTSFADLECRLNKEAVPFSKIYSIADIASDAHVIERKALIEIQDPELGVIPAPAPVPRFPGRNFRMPEAGPSTGQHNAEVYAALGLDHAQLDELRTAGVI